MSGRVEREMGERSVMSEWKSGELEGGGAGEELERMMIGK